MKNKEILYKAIKKAMVNGYKPNKGFIDNSIRYCEAITSAKNRHWFIIFDLDFARNFFGKQKHHLRKDWESDNDYCDLCKAVYSYGLYANPTEYCWQYHLQQMVLEEEPLKYLEKFLN